MTHKIKSLLTLCLFSFALFSYAPELYSNVGSKETLKEISKGFSAVAKEATPAVVFIESQGVSKDTASTSHPRKGPHENPFDYFQDDFFNRFFGHPFSDDKPSRKSEMVRGTGFIVSADGYIITNNHVVENASKVHVTLHNGNKVIATIIGTDAKTDLAVIKIDETKLPFLTFGNSDKLEVGDWTIAVGNPFGLQASVTVGVVSAKGRSQLNITDFDDFIQTDAAINPGNSGGPLLNVDGEVIGINTAIVSGSGGYMGIGFAIPSNMATKVMDQLIKDGSVTRGFLGVTLQPVDPELAKFYKLDKPQGALITDVVKGSPADVAGLKVEDVIIGFDNAPVDSLSTFRNAVSLMPPGSKISLRIVRDGKQKEIKVTITSAPGDIVGPSSLSQKLGFIASNLTPEISQQLGYVDEKGVVIMKVQPETPAAEAGLRPGNLVVAVNRKKVTTLDEYNEALSKASKDGKVLLMVRHGDAVRFVALNFE